MSLYDVLGVEAQASPEEIRRAFRRLARQWHPDAARESAEAGARMTELNAAWRVLGDAAQRQAYDETLGRDPSAAWAPVVGEPPGPEPHWPVASRVDPSSDTAPAAGAIAALSRLLPILGLTVGLPTLALGFVSGSRGFTALGMALLGLGGAGVLLVVLFELRGRR